MGDGSFGDWSTLERTGSRIAEVREDRVGRVMREIGRRCMAGIRKGRGLLSRGESRFSWKDAGGEVGIVEGIPRLAGRSPRRGERISRAIDLRCVWAGRRCS